MIITYNGITFGVLRIPPGGWLHEIATTEDGAQQVYSHHRIKATCWLSWGGTDGNSFDPYWQPAPCPIKNFPPPPPLPAGGSQSALKTYQGGTNQLTSNPQAFKPQTGFAYGSTPSLAGGPIGGPGFVIPGGLPGFTKGIPINQGVTGSGTIVNTMPPIQTTPGAVNNSPGQTVNTFAQVPPYRFVFPNSPVQTYQEILKRLAYAPGQLLVTMDSNPDPSGGVEIVLQSPLPGFTTDARFGPQAKVLSPVPVGGNTSMVLDMEFETWLPLCTYQGGPFILSNRWSYWVSHDDQHFATHVYKGEATFNVALMTAQGGMVSPDQFRGWLVPPPPPGFQRQKPTFEGISSGDTLAYTVIDVQKPIYEPGAVAADAAEIEIVHNQQYEGSKWDDKIWEPGGPTDRAIKSGAAILSTPSLWLAGKISKLTGGR